MLSYYKFRKISNYFFESLPKLTFFFTVFGFAFLWCYLKNIEKLDFFVQMNISSYGLFSILLFFMIFGIYMCLPFFSIDFFLNVYRTGKGNEFLYSINQSMMILFFLVLLFLYDFDVYDRETKSLTVILIFILIILFTISFIFNIENKNKKEFLMLTINSLFFSVLFVAPLLFITRVVNDDMGLFIFIILYLAFLIISNFLSLKEKHAFTKFIMCVLFIIAISLISDGFKLQRIVLKPIGIAQYPEQSGWYAVRNKYFLNYMNRNYSIKYQKNADGSENYIYGYLILNIGNVRVICPDNLEDSSESQDKIDFSQCLTLTSEDIKFMGKKEPFGEIQQ